MANSHMELTRFERAILMELARDEAAPRPSGALAIDALVVDSRSLTGKGFITELCANEASCAYPANVSLRWGDTLVARINGEELVGMVIYVDEGRLTALEAYTFGGRNWPTSIRSFTFEAVTGSVRAKPDADQPPKPATSSASKPSRRGS